MLSPIFNKIFNRRTLSKWLFGFVLLIGLIIWVQHKVGWTTLLKPWLSLPLEQLAILIAITITSYVLRAVRVYDYSYKILQGSFLATLRLTLLHNALNNFLPMRLGESAYPILMKIYFNQNYVASSVTLLWIRVLDLHFLGIPALIFLYITQKTQLWLWLIPFWLSLVPIMYWSHNLLHQQIANHSGRFAMLMNKILGHVPDNLGQFLRIWLWTALIWTCKLFAFTSIVLHFSNLSVGHAVLGTLGAELSSVLPIHGVAGAGTYELAMSAVLLPLGINVNTILTAAVNLHLYLLGTSILLAMWGLLLPYPTGRIAAPLP